MQYLESNSYFAQNRVVIDLDALRHNLRAIKSLLKDDCEILPVVKSDAYGHGILEVSRVLLKEGVWGLSVFDITEAFKLIENHIQTRIFLLAGLFPANINFHIPQSFVIGITNHEILKKIDSYSKLHRRRIEAHLKLDTGMSRFGFSPNEIHEIVRDRDKYEYLEFSGIYSHLPCADTDRGLTLRQISLLSDTLESLRHYGWYPRWIHTANSASTINIPESHFNLVRPGISLYGYKPASSLREINLKPVMELKSRLIELKCIKKGATIGYGCSFIAKNDMKIGIIPLGYDDGYMRILSNSDPQKLKTHVIIKGKRTPILGKICMKAIIVSLDSYQDVQIGDEVTLVGKDGDEEITLEELAEKANTIPYELMCLIGTRNKRIYLQSCLD